MPAIQICCTVYTVQSVLGLGRRGRPRRRRRPWTRRPADLAARKSRETGRLVSPADVAIVKWSVASDSLASSRLAGLGGTATLNSGTVMIR